MHLRPRPDGTAAAARVARVLEPRVGGWVPEWDPPVPEPSLSPEPPAPERRAPDGPEASRSWASQRGEPEPQPQPEPEPGRRAVPERAGAGPEPEPYRGVAPEPVLGPVVAGRRLRLDPGRGGAAALCAVVAVAALAAAAVVLRGRPQEVAAPVLESVGAPLPGLSAPAEPAGQVLVAVAGRVRRPGVVRLPAGSRVDDALRAAGGPLDPADVGLLNLARKLVDGEQVLVGVDPPPGAAPAPGGGPVPGALLDLNAATAGDLDALPGIGPVLAQRIVDWRTSHGPFASVDQLREVTGIGEAKFEDLRSKVVVP